VCGFELPISETGAVLPHDHPDLIPGRRVIRRISEDFVVVDENRGCRRLSSSLFKSDPRSGYLSVDSEHCIIECGADPQEYVTSPRWFGALILDVGEFRLVDTSTSEESLWRIGMVPLDENVCHGAIWGKITKGQSNTLQRNSEWLVEIPGIEKLSVETE
jgi:hypothetical protein